MYRLKRARNLGGPESGGIEEFLKLALELSPLTGYSITSTFASGQEASTPAAEPEV